MGYEVLICADNADLLGENKYQKNTQALLDAIEETCLKVNTEKSKYIFMSYHHVTGQNHYIKVASRCSENVSWFRYLEVVVTNQNYIHMEINSRLNMGNVCCLQFRIFCLPAFCQKIYKLKSTELSFWFLFCVGMKLEHAY
jgi:hypothetical protein